MEECKRFFILADQYYETAKLLLETLLNNSNSQCGVSNTAEGAIQEMNKNYKKSDAALFIPALFCAMQAVELFLKGILLLNNNDIINSHEVSNMLKMLKECYSEKSDIYKCFQEFYSFNEIHIKEYKKENNINNTNDLYESLRYPKSKKGIYFDYYTIKYNGIEGYKIFKKIIENMDNVREETCTEYNKRLDIIVK